MLHPKKTHLVLVPSTVLAFLGRTFLVKYTEANRIHLILSRVLEDKSGILSTQSSTWTTPRGSRGSPLTISVLKGDDDDDDAVQISETSWGTSGSNAQARFFFFSPFPSRAEDTRVVGAAVHVSPPQLVGEDHVGGGHFQRKVRATYLRWPPCRKMITSVSLSNMAVTGKDFPSLVCKDTRQVSQSLLNE